MLMALNVARCVSSGGQTCPSSLHWANHGVWEIASGRDHSNAVVQGNIIGLNAAGNAPLGNNGYGVEINNAAGNAVGGDSPAARNIISANSQGGDGNDVVLTALGTPGTAGLVADVEHPGQQVLLAVGTPGNDVIGYERHSGSVGFVSIILNGHLTACARLDQFDRIVVHGLEGDDRITIDKHITKPAYLFGDEGNDELVGGRGDDVIRGGAGADHIDAGDGDDVLLGDEGNDQANGGKGRDLLIGGLGQDTLNGGHDDDILIGGHTTHDHDDTALLAVMSSWASSASYPDRVAAVEGLLSVEDDNEPDSLLGENGRDLFYAGLGDLLIDLMSVAHGDTVS